MLWDLSHLSDFCDLSDFVRSRSWQISYRKDFAVWRLVFLSLRLLSHKFYNFSMASKFEVSTRESQLARCQCFASKPHTETLIQIFIANKPQCCEAEKKFFFAFHISVQRSCVLHNNIHSILLYCATHEVFSSIHLI